jgi:hypothetical protein
MKRLRTASEDKLSPTARLTNIAWAHDVDGVFGTRRRYGLRPTAQN